MVHLSKILDIDLLEKHIHDGNVSARLHPTLPLVIYNYTQQVIKTPEVWGDGVIDLCRGLIASKQGAVVARPFRKFHNIDTSFVPETNSAYLETLSKPLVTEKMDGSLGVFWRYGGDWGIATRGSFESDQAKWATAWYKAEFEARKKDLFSGLFWTPLFEIIYPDNRIVIEYDFEGLVLLGMVDTITGQEMTRQSLEAHGELRGFTGPYIVKQWTDLSLKQALKQNAPNREGYVLTYDRDQDPPLKVKVKFSDYVSMHKVITGLSPKGIWELLSVGAGDMLNLSNAPKHFQEWADKWVDKLYEEFAEIHQVAEMIYLNRPIYLPGADRQYRKECSDYFKKEVELCQVNKGVIGCLYAMLDGKTPDDIIWKLIKPRGDDKSFRTDGE